MCFTLFCVCRVICFHESHDLIVISHCTFFEDNILASWRQNYWSCPDRVSAEITKSEAMFITRKLILVPAVLNTAVSRRELWAPRVYILKNIYIYIFFTFLDWSSPWSDKENYYLSLDRPQVLSIAEFSLSSAWRVQMRKPVTQNNIYLQQSYLKTIWNKLSTFGFAVALLSNNCFKIFM